jgi:hypothetical protein
MSYSFSARGATKDECLKGVLAKMDEVVAAQPIHSTDRQQAYDAAKAFLEIIPGDADDRDFYVSVSGSVGWNGLLGVDAVVTSVGVSVSASLVVKEKVSG